MLAAMLAAGTHEVHVPEQAKATNQHDWISAEEYGLKKLRTTVVVKDDAGRVLVKFNFKVGLLYPTCHNV